MSLSAGNKPIKDVTDPTQPQEAATKHYVDGAVIELPSLATDVNTFIPSDITGISWRNEQADSGYLAQVAAYGPFSSYGAGAVFNPLGTTGAQAIGKKFCAPPARTAAVIHFAAVLKTPGTGKIAVQWLDDTGGSLQLTIIDLAGLSAAVYTDTLAVTAGTNYHVRLIQNDAIGGFVNAAVVLGPVTLTFTGGSPTGTLAGSFERIDLQPLNAHGSLYQDMYTTAPVGGYGRIPYVDPYSRYVFETDQTDLVLEYTNSWNSSARAAADITIWIRQNGQAPYLHARLNTSGGANRKNVYLAIPTLPDGTKTIEIWAGGQIQWDVTQYPTASKGPRDSSWQGSVPLAIYAPRGRNTLIPPQPRPARVLVVGDSIAGGFTGAGSVTEPTLMAAWIAIRHIFPGDVLQHAAASSSWHDLISTDAQMFDLLDHIASAHITHLWCEGHVNDTGCDLAGSPPPSVWQNLAAYSARMGVFLDALHDRCLDLLVFLQDALPANPGTTEAVTNSNGETISDYRTATRALATARPGWIKSVHGTDLIAAYSAGLYDDAGGIHPNDNGHAVILPRIVAKLAEAVGSWPLNATAGAYAYPSSLTVGLDGKVAAISAGSAPGAGTVTSIAAGTGLDGGTITGTGTISIHNQGAVSATSADLIDDLSGDEPSGSGTTLNALGGARDTMSAGEASVISGNFEILLNAYNALRADFLSLKAKVVAAGMAT